MQLHFAQGSVATALAPALEEATTPSAPVPVDFAAGAQRSPEYLGADAKGRVPAMVTGDGVRSKTGAILEYIGKGAAMIPDTGMRRTRVRAKAPRTRIECCAFLEAAWRPDHFEIGDRLAFAETVHLIASQWAAGDDEDRSASPKPAAYKARLDACPSVKVIRDKGVFA